MGIADHIKATPWWLAPLLFAGTVFIGIYLGAPIAVSYYSLSYPSEVQRLFALMPFVYFYLLIPLCLVGVVGLRIIRVRSTRLVSAAYVFLCFIAVPAVFYGIGVSNYYR